MESYDIIMLVVLVGATIFGAWKGLAWQVASLASIVLSYLVALEFRDEVARHISAEPPWNMFCAMLILYLGTSLAIWIAFRLVSDFIDRLKLKEFDRQIGALLGLAKGVALCTITTLFAVTLVGPDSEWRQMIEGSRSARYIAVLLDKAHAIMPPEAHDAVSTFIHTLDETLPDGYQTTDEHHHFQGQATPGRTLDELNRGELIPRVAEQFYEPNQLPPAAELHPLRPLPGAPGIPPGDFDAPAYGTAERLDPTANPRR